MLPNIKQPVEKIKTVPLGTKVKMGDLNRKSQEFQVTETILYHTVTVTIYQYITVTIYDYFKQQFLFVH